MNELPLRPTAEPHAHGVAPRSARAGRHQQLSYYSVEARQCSCCKDPPIRYFLRSIEGKVLAMALSWERLCHAMNWWPLDGLPACARLPKQAPKQPNKKSPRTIIVDNGPRPLFEGMDVC